MSTRNKYDGVLNDYAIELIQFKAKQLTKKQGFSKSDLNDLEQDLAFKLWEQLDKFDPSEAQLNTFIHKIVENLVISIIRAKGRLKRGINITVSIDDQITDNNSVKTTRLESIDHESFLVMTGVVPRNFEDQSALRIDTDSLIRTLPDDLQDTCRLLMKASIPEVANLLGLHRSSVNMRVKRIRKHFIDMGLSDPRES